MALDDFGTVDENSSSNNSTKKRHKKESQPNLDHHIQQAFTDDQQVTARAIQYQINSLGFKWATTFSRLRFENGEKVYYASGNIGQEKGKTVAVFTSIQGFTMNHLPDDTQDIWVVIWDLDKSDNVNDGTYISPQDGWREQLLNSIEEQARNI